MSCLGWEPPESSRHLLTWYPVQAVGPGSAPRPGDQCSLQGLCGCVCVRTRPFCWSHIVYRPASFQLLRPVGCKMLFSWDQFSHSSCVVFITSHYADDPQSFPGELCCDTVPPLHLSPSLPVSVGWALDLIPGRAFTQ